MRTFGLLRSFAALRTFAERTFAGAGASAPPIEDNPLIGSVYTGVVLGGSVYLQPAGSPLMVNYLDTESTNTVSLKGLRNLITKAYPLDATVVLVELLDDAGVPVASLNNTAMPLVGGTSGRSSLYRAVIPHTTALVAGTTYTARVQATSAGDVRMFNVSCPARAA